MSNITNIITNKIIKGYNLRFAKSAGKPNRNQKFVESAGNNTKVINVFINR